MPALETVSRLRLAAALLCAVFPCLPTPAAAQVRSLEILSVQDASLASPFASRRTDGVFDLTPDGRFVLLQTDALNFTTGSSSSGDRTLLLDRSTGRFEAALRGRTGRPILDGPDHAQLSHDGRYVAFALESQARPHDGLVAGSQAYLRDRQTGALWLASADAQGNPGTGFIEALQLSGDGRFVVLETDGQLLPEDTDSAADIYVYDRELGSTVLASTDAGLFLDTDPATEPSVSDDGRFVVFRAGRDDAEQVYLRDLQLGTTERVSEGPNGMANEASWSPSISGDGLLIAFASFATNLDPAARFGNGTLFVHDVVTGSTRAITPDGAEPYHLRMSQDGSHVAFVAQGVNLVSGDTNDRADILIVPTDGSGPIERVNVGEAGQQAASGFGFNVGLYSIDASGDLIAFISEDDGLVAEDQNGVEDLLLRRRSAGDTVLLSKATVAPAVIGASNSSRPATCCRRAISADGRRVVFSSFSDILVANDSNGLEDIFVHDRDTRAVRALSVTPGGQTGNSWSSSAEISADGRFVVFHSRATDLVGEATGGVFQVYLHDLEAGTTQLVSRDLGDLPGNADSLSPTLSADARYLAFSTRAGNMLPGLGAGALGNPMVVMIDLVEGTRRLVSRGPSGELPNQLSEPVTFAAHGNHLLFWSAATNLGFGTGGSGLYRYTLSTDTVALATVHADGSAGQGIVERVGAISADGRYVAFEALYGAYVPGQQQSTRQVFLRDVQDGTTVEAERLPGTVLDQSTRLGGLSDDGRYVLFSSLSPDILPEQDRGILGEDSDLFLFDRSTARYLRISEDPLGNQAYRTSSNEIRRTAMTGDARFVVFDGEGKDYTVSYGGMNAQSGLFFAERVTVADLQLTLSDGGSAKVPGEALSYDLRVRNAGPEAAQDARVADAFPDGLDCDWTSTGIDGGSAAMAGSDDIDEPLELPAGAEVRFQADCLIDSAATGTLDNVAVVTGRSIDDLPDNNTASVQTALSPTSNLAITLQAPSAPLLANEPFSYAMRVENLGPSRSASAMLVPLDSTHRVRGCPDPRPQGCELGPLTPGQHLDLVLDAAVPADPPPELTLGAAIQGSGLDPAPDNDAASARLATQAVADLALTLAAADVRVAPGAQTSVTATLRNAGPSTEPSAQVQFTLPAGVSELTSAGCIGDPAGQTTCLFPPLAPGAEASVTLSYTLSEQTLEGYTVQADVGGAALDPSTANNAASVPVGILAADLSVALAASPPRALPGTPVDLTILVANAGPADALDVSLALSLDAALIEASSQGCANDPEGAPACVIGTLPAGDQREIRVRLRVDSAAMPGTNLSGEASVTSSVVDPSMNNNRATFSFSAQSAQVFADGFEP